MAIDIKSATLFALRMVLHSSSTDTLLDALDKRMKDAGSFFENEAIVLDASLVDADIDWAPLLQAVRSHKLHPVGVVPHDANRESALCAGLAEVDLGSPPARPAPAPAAEADIPAVTSASPGLAPEAAAVSEGGPTAPPAGPPPAAMVVNRPLRSGQRIYARHTDLIIIGVVSQGAEVIADGNIHVYGPLRGKAMAGARGDTSARIFTTQLDPELLAIAGVYRVVEAPLESSQRNKPCLIQLENDTLRIQPLGD